MTYHPSPTAIDDTYQQLLAWVGPDADCGVAAVALSVHKDMSLLSRELRMAVLARFPSGEREPVPGKDFFAPDEPEGLDKP
jgi:hypothetical protein